LAAVFFGIIAGCGGTAKDAPKTIAVTGTVNFKGQPLAGAMVVFAPTSPGLRAATGTTDSSGRFKLTTLAPGDGAMAGSYTVTVAKSEGGPAAPSSIASLSEAEKRDPQAMKAAWEKDKAAAKEAEKSAAKTVLPSKYGSAKDSGLTAEVKSGGKNDFTFDLKE
jgi:hypothetical protein